MISVASLKESNILTNEEEPFGQVMEGSQIVLSGYFWDNQYGDRFAGSWSYFDNPLNSEPGPFHHFVLYTTSTPDVTDATGLILAEISPNTFKRIGVFETPTTMLRGKLVASGLFQKFQNLDENDVSVMLSLLGEKVDIILV